MNVLYVTPGFHPAVVYGGTTESAWGFTRGLDDAGCRVQVLTTDANGPTTLRVPERVALGRRSEVLYCRRWRREATAPSLIPHLFRRARDADVMVLNATFNFTTFPALAAARHFDKPLVWAPRGAVLALDGAPPPRKTLWLRAMRAAMPRVAAAHCTSSSEAETLQPWFPDLRAFVSPNGVRIPTERATHASESPLHIVTIGRIHPIKGIDKLLRALAEFDAPWRCTIAGDATTPYAASLRDLARSLGLGDRVVFVGHLAREDCDRLLSSASVYVCASESENFGQSVAEALAAGVPVIASTGTPWSGVEREACGLWVDNAPPSLRNALARMLALPRAEMGARGREWMAREFSWERVCRGWLAEANALRIEAGKDHLT